MRRLKKIISTFLVFTLLVYNLSFAPYIRAEAPSAPSAPTAPEMTEAPSAPSAPEAPSAPSSSQEEESSNESSPSSTTTPTPTETLINEVTPTPTETPQSALETTNSQTGDTAIKTGDATNQTAVTSPANTNLSADPLLATSTGGDSLSMSNTDNGTGSNNETSIDNNTNTSTVQENKAKVVSEVNSATVTGGNSASQNVGNSFIETGDANVTATAITGVNSNLANVTVSEFNIADVQTGDLVLDFSAGCVSGCGLFNPAQLSNTDNGANSENSIDVNSQIDNTTFQNNDADVGNYINLTADSGNNTASLNTGGDSVIKTGDANVSASSLTFANNNIAGQVLYGVINIFGTLIGDIILPDFAQLAPASTIANTGNGSGSVNDINLSQTTDSDTNQFNNAEINNALITTTQTGGNQTSLNTGGDSVIKTGQSSVDANVLNVANSNIEGGNWWLVIVNEAGKWVGKILGMPDGAAMAGSEGTLFTVDDQGQITAVNSDNGANSQNNINTNLNSNTTVDQSNTAVVNNVLDLSALSGNNKASKNTGGDSFIQTGDANIVANMVNFVNNNISGGGKLVVTVVNVFGSWLGDFISPGQKKQAKTEETSTTNNLTTTTENSMNSDNSDENNLEQNQSKAVSTSNPSPKINTKKSEPTTIISTFTTKFSTTPSILGAVSQSAENLIAGVNSKDDNSLLSNVLLKKDQSGKPLVINLAWLLLLIPFGTLYYSVRLFQRIKKGKNNV